VRRFDSILIANRGEIVTRVARSARSLGFRTIAVASTTDARAPHVQACDEHVDIGGQSPADSYLRIDKLLHAARVSDAQAIHPGYGFLSESAEFAHAVTQAGFVWIGPSPAAMRAMADKSSARKRMAAAGVAVLPGYDDEDQRLTTLEAAAQRIGFPLMIKARAGGGGRGMRLIERADQLAWALSSAATEAKAAFGDARLMLERALLAPRHVEVQIFGDSLGNVIHLGERDCSVQRRHQKLVEEAPCPVVSGALRRRMGAVAVAVAREVDYVGAGTVEFLLDADAQTAGNAGAEFWFMEMNTRLQVEHPVTEALVGVDLVEWQLKIASGAPLALSQEDAIARYENGGHAIEVRLCAEDADRDHLPQSGKVLHWQPPRTVRCDHALVAGCDISPFYDSLLAKLIAHAPSRGEAIQQLADALDRTVCLGLTTNRSFLARVLRHSAFEDAAVNTAFLAQNFPAGSAKSDAPPSWLRSLAAAVHATLSRAAPPQLWAGWTSSNHVDTAAPLSVDGFVESWHLMGSPNMLSATCDTTSHTIVDLVRRSRSIVQAVIDGRPVTARCVQECDESWWLCEGFELTARDMRLASTQATGGAAAGAVNAPMHGRITQVLVATGASVSAGALLIVMEAMKMEHQMLAPFAGIVTVLHTRIGEQVAARQMLIEIEARPAL
jgi:geranyl-CoA carboxylase alpha subunit